MEIIAALKSRVRLATGRGAESGIAIGPILFIIAVLGILAAAIAAGSGSFTTGTTGESNRTKAAAMIDIGQNLKVGFDRIIGEGTDFTDVMINVENTSAATSLFSPLGGGIAAPSTTMAATPGTDIWFYPLWAIPQLGTSAGSRVAVIRVAAGVCDEINVRAAALAAGTALTDSASLGDFTSTSLNTLSNWPADFKGKPTGCIYNSASSSALAPAGYYFYQVLGIQ